MPTPPPASIGRYAVRREIRRDPSGIVAFLARDTRLDRDVTLELLPRAWTNDRERLDRFERDVRVIAGLSDPHVATIHSLERAGDRHFVTMEFVPGRTLRDTLAAEALPLEVALTYGRHIADALVAGHARRILHRGLEPNRVIVTPDGVAKVTDFGLGVAEGAPITDARAAGASEYTSPEQLEGHPPDVRSDIFAFGALALTCLTGRFPFAGTTTAERIANARDFGVDPTLLLPGELPPGIRSLLLGCVSVSPEDRPSTMKAIRHDLDQAILQLSASKQERARRRSDRIPGNLPAPVGGFVGGKQLDQVAALVGEEPLVTLTGAPGVGKTRLAIEAAHVAASRFPKGVWLIDVSSETNVAAAATRIDETTRGAAADVVIIDGADHVLDAAREVARDERFSRVVVTSREALGLDLEHVYRVTPLPPAHALELLTTSARAAGASVDMEGDDRTALLGIATRVDGLPLALQLAAARLRALPPNELLARLSNPLRVLGARSKTAAARHESVRAAIEWSARRLSEDERRTLARLASRTGSASGGDTGVDPDVVERLAMKGFLEVGTKRPGTDDAGTEPHLYMLNLIRAFFSEP